VVHGQAGWSQPDSNRRTGDGSSMRMLQVAEPAHRRPRFFTNNYSCREVDMPARDKTLDDLFVETLKDIYFAEKKILAALPKLAKAAQSKELRAAFEKHHGETEKQVERLEQIFEMIEQPAKGKTCPAILGLMEEEQEVMKDFKETHALDAALLSGAQSVEHYEIARYGALCAWAKQLNKPRIAELLHQTLEEEKATDMTLSRLATSQLNRMAA
jgi:ferritin-like metal-binding protein YciE